MTVGLKVSSRKYFFDDKFFSSCLWLVFWFALEYHQILLRIFIKLAKHHAQISTGHVQDDSCERDFELEQSTSLAEIPNTSDAHIGCDIIPCYTRQKLMWNISNEINIDFIKIQVFIYYQKYQIKPRLRLTFHFAVLCNAIKNNTSVMTVNFSGCSLTWKGADTLAKVIKV